MIEPTNSRAKKLKMFYKLIILSVIIGGVACTLDESAETNEPLPGAAYKASFDKINEYLEKNVESKDAEANMAAAKNWLVNDLTKNQSEDPNLEEAVKLFTSLDQVSGEDSCNENSLEILMNNEAALGGGVLDDDDGDDDDVEGIERNEEEIDRRIELIFEYYAEKYGCSCIPPDAEPLDSKSGYQYNQHYNQPYNQHYNQPHNQHYNQPYNQQYRPNNAYYRPIGYNRRKFAYKISKFWRKLVYNMKKGFRRRRYYRQQYGYNQQHGYDQHGGNVNLHYNRRSGVNFGCRFW